MNDQDRNIGWIGMLSLTGGLTIALGLLLALMLFAQFSESAPYPFRNRDGITGVGASIALAVAFYHFVGGMICFGIAKALAEATSANRQSQNHAPVLSATPTASFPPVTVCLNCGRSYEGTTHGAFCESCGRKLPSPIPSP